jgi:hypothetical protein
MVGTRLSLGGILISLVNHRKLGRRDFRRMGIPAADSESLFLKNQNLPAGS